MSNYDLGALTSSSSSINSYSVTSSAPTDVFEFSISSTSKINLSLHDITTGDDADLRLYQDSNFNGLFDSSDLLVASSRRGSNLDDSINYQASGGTYFAQVERYAPGSSGSVFYDLDLSATSLYSPSNLLPNEVQVGDLASDRTYSGRVNNTDTSNVYSFSLGFYEGVNISLTGLSADADIRLIQDTNGNDIVDTGEVVGSSSRGGTLSDLISGTDLSGNYLLQVYQYSGNTNYQVTFDHYTTPWA